MVSGDYGLRKDVDNIQESITELYGMNAKDNNTYSIKCNVDVIKYTNNTYTPDVLTFSSYRINSKGVMKYESLMKLYGSNDNSEWVLLVTTTTSKINYNIGSATTHYKYYKCELYDSNLERVDYETVPVLTDGTDGTSTTIIELDNEAITIPCESDGTVSAELETVINFQGYTGTSKKATTSTSVDIPSAISSDVEGTVESEATSTNSGKITLTFKQGATLDDNASGVIPITSTCNTITFSKQFTYSKSIKGTDGEDGDDGTDGTDGDDGISAYVWIAYSDSTTKPETTAEIYEEPTGHKPIWIGFVNKDEKRTSSPKIEDGYKWSKYKGDAGVSVTSVTNYYAISESKTSAPEKESGKWDTTMQTTTTTEPYLWNYEKILLSDGTFTTTTSHIISEYGNGVKSEVQQYLATATNDTPTQKTEGWSENPPSLTNALPYLWIWETITYTDSEIEEVNRIYMAGKYGDTGADGNTTQYIEQSIQETIQEDKYTAQNINLTSLKNSLTSILSMNTSVSPLILEKIGPIVIGSFNGKQIITYSGGVVEDYVTVDTIDNTDFYPNKTTHYICSVYNTRLRLTTSGELQIFGKSGVTEYEFVGSFPYIANVASETAWLAIEPNDGSPNYKVSIYTGEQIKIRAWTSTHTYINDLMIQITINNRTYTRTTVDGYVYLNINLGATSSASSKTYPISLSVLDSTYGKGMSYPVQTSITVNKVTIKLDKTTGDYDVVKGNTLKIQLLNDSTNEGVGNLSCTLKINGVNYNVTSDSEGYISKKINLDITKYTNNEVNNFDNTRVINATTGLGFGLNVTSS